MRNQMMVERYKALRFHILYIATLVTMTAGFFYGFLKLPANLDTTAVFSSTVCDTSGFFIYTLVAAWFAGNDFLNRTIHNEIKAGYSRFSVILTRAVTSSMMEIFLHLTFIVATIAGFGIKNGFDFSVFTLTNLSWLLTVLLQICASTGIVMFIIFLLRNVTLGITVTVVSSFVGYNVLRNFIAETVFRLTPFSLAQTGDSRTLALSAAVAAAVIAVFLTATHLVFKKAEIK